MMVLIQNKNQLSNCGDSSRDYETTNMCDEKKKK